MGERRQRQSMEFAGFGIISSSAKGGSGLSEIIEPWVSNPSNLSNQKTTLSGGFLVGGPGGIRTHDQLLKRQLLYH